MRSSEGQRLALACHRWLAPADDDDRAVVDRVRGPAMDVGCGPGRHLLELCGRGIPALGVEVAPRAVEIARAQGLPVLQRSVFDSLPGEGRWRTILLLDGSIGIGGSPLDLLSRLSQLAARGGRLLVEAEPPGCSTETLTVRLETRDESGPWFPWARVGVNGLKAAASEAGLALVDAWRGPSGHRWFAELQVAAGALS